jgi:HAD domain in Swiss Army Knife RNA repair proteins
MPAKLRVPTNHPPLVYGLSACTPVLFLDFDGVVHPYDSLAIEANVRSQDDAGRFCWLPLLTDALAAHPSVRIVVTSDWRHFSDADKLRGLLGPLAARFAGSTGLASGFTRADYIQQVVQLHLLQHWCALDDDPSVVRAALEEPRFVACDSATGLSEPLVTAAVIHWLQRLPA